MQYRENTSKYFEMIMDLVKEITLPIMHERKKDFEESIRNTILGIDHTITVDSSIPQRDQFIANKLFRPLSEILSAVEAIENIAIYIRSFPYKRQGISRYAYLKYHIENYLNEMYLLQNRLIAYLTLIERSYKKSNNVVRVSEITTYLHNAVSKILKSYIEIRGYYVHQNRYSDNEFDRLSTLELLSKSEDDFGDLMHEIFINAYRDTRKKWIGKIKKDIEGIHNLLELYFEQLMSAISKEGKIVYPSQIPLT